MYFNEDDLIVKRIKHLTKFVDRFLVIEGNYTHSGFNKKFQFKENHPELSRNPKVIYIQHEINLNSIYWRFQKWRKGHGVSWKLEGAQRNAVIPHLRLFRDDDIVLYGDLDEFPSHYVFEYLKSNLEKIQASPHVCLQKNHIYSLKYLYEGDWSGTIVSSVLKLRAHTPKGLRSMRNDLEKINLAGWHLSFFMDREKISEKIMAFAHQEFNNKALAMSDHVQWALENGVDIFNMGRKIIKRGVIPPEYDEISWLFERG
jgi:beta-1,4-mannosyl-glycoprotein beta-1,4-N-acetylglucosaminyltransferase